MSKTAFINCSLLDGTRDMTLQEGVTVLVENNRITAVGKDIAVPSDAEKIDLTGKYMMPGMINAHIHLPSSGMPGGSSRTPEQVQKMKKSKIIMAVMKQLCKKAAKTQLMSGTTTVRTVGGVDDIDSTIRDEINAGKYLGPRIIASNMAVSVPGGHMAGVLAFEATSPEEGVKFVDKIAKDKPDLIKLMITGGVLDGKRGEPGELKMDPAIIKAACDEAHKLGYYVAAHVESPEGVRAALENGVDTIEHGAKPDEQIIELFKERKAADICTISPAAPIAMIDPKILKLPEDAQFNGNIVLKGIVDCAKECIANDIPVGLGTDAGCPWVFHYDTWRELAYFSKYLGVSPEFTIYTATLSNAKILGIDKETGSIEPGKSADLLVLGANPLDDFKTLSKPEMVVMKGRVIRNPKIKKHDEIDRQLDELFEKL